MAISINEEILTEHGKERCLEPNVSVLVLEPSSQNHLGKTKIVWTIKDCNGDQIT